MVSSTRHTDRAAAAAWCGSAALVYIVLRKVYPPAVRGAVVPAVVGFVMSIAWIFLISDHLVLTIKALAAIFGIPVSVLGMTVQAFGFSAADFVSNIAMTRMGHAESTQSGKSFWYFDLCLFDHWRNC